MNDNEHCNLTGVYVYSPMHQSPILPMYMSSYVLMTSFFTSHMSIELDAAALQDDNNRSYRWIKNRALVLSTKSALLYTS